MKINMRVTAKLAGVALMLLSISGETIAIPISNASSGLTSPDEIINFNGIAGGTVITNQFVSQGVTFNGSFVIQIGCVPVILDNTCSNSNGVLSNIYSIMFSQTVNKSALQLVTNAGTTTFTALLGGSVVELFSTSTNRNNLNDDYYGFTGIVFDEIQYTISADGSNFNLDNVQYNVPEPSIILLLSSGLALIGFVRRKA